MIVDLDNEDKKGRHIYFNHGENCWICTNNTSQKKIKINKIKT